MAKTQPNANTTDTSAADAKPADTTQTASSATPESNSTTTESTAAPEAAASASSSTSVPPNETKVEDVISIPAEAIEGLKTFSQQMYARMKASIRENLAAGKDADTAFHEALAEGSDTFETVARKMRNNPTFSVNPEKIATDTKPPAMVRTSTLLWLSAAATLIGGAIGVGAASMANRKAEPREALNLPN